MVTLPITVSITVAAGAPVAAGVMVGSLMAIGCLLGVLLTPDLDIASRTHTSGVPFVGGPWKLLWWPYGKLIRHRSPHSHLPLWGTLWRQVYLLTILWLLGWVLSLLQVSLPEFWRWMVEQWWYWWLLSGVAISDSVHWVRDW
jgi:uncharacterized metal-binding protein